MPNLVGRRHPIDSGSVAQPAWKGDVSAADIMVARAGEPMAIDLFYSCSDSAQDRELRSELDKHLAILKRGNILNSWYSGELLAGGSLSEIDDRLDAASIVLLLVSSDFFASDTCDHQMTRALQRLGASPVQVLAVILRACDWQGAPFQVRGVPVLPKEAKPITSWQNRDEAFMDAAIQIRKTVEVIALTPRPSPPTRGPLAILGSLKTVLGAAIGTVLRTPDASISSSPATPTTYYDAGVRCLAEGKYEEGIAALNQAIRMDPNFAYAFYNRGIGYYFLDNQTSAIADFNRALELGFSTSLLFRNRANAYTNTGETEKALADYERAIDLEPTNPLAYLNRGLVHERAGRLDSAAADYRSVLGLDTDEVSKQVARTRLESLGAG
ncbi:MAG: tetratricopeptide repeat protein [Bryobacteraceae bacterium]